MKVLCLKANIEKADLNYKYLEQKKDENVITFAEVKERLKNKSLAEYTDRDVFDRYIVYGEEYVLNKPEIQQLIIQHGYKEELIELGIKLQK